jgi:hypothetical protein
MPSVESANISTTTGLPLLMPPSELDVGWSGSSATGRAAVSALLSASAGPSASALSSTSSGSTVSSEGSSGTSSTSSMDTISSSSGPNVPVSAWRVVPKGRGVSPGSISATVSASPLDS